MNEEKIFELEGQKIRFENKIKTLEKERQVLTHEIEIVINPKIDILQRQKRVVEGLIIEAEEELAKEEE